ncbi:hypothetical protein [Giesbergeria anulus]|uniref:Secreted protein n=1 Tax=Giesbergeria anulus TaxID=180197 RepID=A0A1H9PY59_9BURK|nr:hypothetical protein SAMN02982919_02550 [Giesbergeria anulus]
MNKQSNVLMTLKRFLVLSGLTVLFTNVSASPGAHGPNGEHLDGAPKAGATSTNPRFEAKSEAYELVGRLQGGELSMFINRFATNEPVDGAKVEVEFGELKATAPFHSDQGDYAVADESFLKALSTPGSHALVITLVDGNESDLLDGTLEVGKPTATSGDAEHGHGHNNKLIYGGLALAALLAAGGTGWLLGRSASKRNVSVKGGTQ